MSDHERMLTAFEEIVRYAAMAPEFGSHDDIKDSAAKLVTARAALLQYLERSCKGEKRNA